MIGNVKLKFEDGALHTIAREALKTKTGARGLRSILENAMLDIMHHIMPVNDMGVGRLPAVIAKIALELVITVLAVYVRAGS